MSQEWTRRGATILLAASAASLAVGSAQAAPTRLIFDLASVPDAPPLLVIQNDGTVFTRNAAAEQITSPRKISAVAIDALSTHLLETLQLDDIDTDAIRDEIENLAATSNRIMALADGPETRITLTTKDAELHIAFYGTDWAAQLFPEIEPLQRLAAARLFLLDIYRDFA